MGKILDSIQKKLQTTEKWPVVISNNDYPIIEESAIIVQILEADGYKVDTFVDSPNNTYGLVINK